MADLLYLFAFLVPGFLCYELSQRFAAPGSRAVDGWRRVLAWFSFSFVLAALLVGFAGPDERYSPFPRLAFLDANPVVTIWMGLFLSFAWVVARDSVLPVCQRLWARLTWCRTSARGLAVQMLDPQLKDLRVRVQLLDGQTLSGQVLAAADGRGIVLHLDDSSPATEDYPGELVLVPSAQVRLIKRG